MANVLPIGNTWFKKRYSPLITYNSGSPLNPAWLHTLSKSYSSVVSDVKVIPNEECNKQQHLVVWEFTAHISQAKKRKFSPSIRTWKLRDPATASQFQSVFKVKARTATAAGATTAGVAADATNRVESVWSKLNDPLLDAANIVYSLSKNHRWRPESWWWNEQVDEAIQRKPTRFKAYNALKKGNKMAGAEAKRLVKHDLWLAKSVVVKKEFATVSPDGDVFFRITNQMDHINQDVMLVSLWSLMTTRWWHGQNTMLGSLRAKQWTPWGLPNCRPSFLHLWSSSIKHSTRWNAAGLMALLA